MNEWVEQQQQQQHATREVPAIGVGAADRELEACLSKANEDSRAAETESAAIRRDKERLASTVKTMVPTW